MHDEIQPDAKELQARNEPNDRARQISRAIENLRSRPSSRRGAYVISDEELNFPPVEPLE